METLARFRTAQRENVRAGSRPTYLSRDRWSLVAAAGFALVLFAASWYRHATFRSDTYDMAVFDQGLWLLAHGKAPYVTVIGRNIFLDHFSPVLLLFVPLYFIAATPLWLLAAQSIALGVGLLALGPLLDELGLNRAWRTAFTVAYVVSLLVWNAALYDFHPSTLAVPFLLVGITGALRDDIAHLLGTSAAVMLLRDDLGLAVVALALVGFRTSSRRRLRLVLALVGVGWVLLGASFGIVVGSPRLWHAYYGYLGPSAGSVILHFWRTVPRLLQGLWRADVGRALLIWLLPFGFLPVLSPGRTVLAFVWALPLFAAAPVLAPGGLDLYHYGAPIFPFLVLGAGTAVTRLPPRLGPRPLIWLLAFSVLSFATYDPVKIHIFDVPAPDARAVERGLKVIHPADAVSAANTLAPHLSHRTLLLPFPYPFATGRHTFPLAEAVAVVSDRGAAEIDAVAIFASGQEATRATIAAFARSPYLRQFRLVFNQQGMLVYRRSGVRTGRP
jgi:uncharacterized membrane protein